MLPCNKEAERYVLRTLLQHRDCAPAVVEKLPDADFYDHAHQCVYRAALAPPHDAEAEARSTGPTCTTTAGSASTAPCSPSPMTACLSTPSPSLTNWTGAASSNARAGNAPTQTKDP